MSDSSMRSVMKRGLQRLGYVVARYDHRRDYRAMRQTLLQHARIDTVLDVGANAGQYAMELRRYGYGGRIISFEPVSNAFASLEANVRTDDAWKAECCALGASDDEAAINVARNSYSSSLLDMLPQHLAAAPASGYVGTETIKIRALDGIFDRYCGGGERVFLKIDTQGFTKQVLDGARNSMPRIAGVQVELSLTPLYAGEPLIGEVISQLYQHGYTLKYLTPEFVDAQSGVQLQVDGLFFRD